MRIVLTGATGFLGSHILDEFLRHDVEVVALARPDGAVDPGARTGVEWRLVDLLDEDGVATALADATHVVHAARLTRPGLRPDQYEAANVTATTNVLDACTVQPPQGVIQISSTWMYGDRLPPWPVDESWAFRPRGAMERSRVTAEQAARTYRRRIPLTVLRPALALGPGAAGPLARLLRHLLEHPKAVLANGGRAPLSLVHAADLARAVWAVLQGFDDTHGRIYHTSSVATDWRTFALEAHRIRETAPRFRSLPLWLAQAVDAVGLAERVLQAPPQMPRYLTLTGRPHLIDDTRLRVAVGYEPLFGLRATLQQTLDWMAERDAAAPR